MRIKHLNQLNAQKMLLVLHHTLIQHYIYADHLQKYLSEVKKTYSLTFISKLKLDEYSTGGTNLTLRINSTTPSMKLHLASMLTM